MMKFFLRECKIPIKKIKAQLIAHENVDIESSVEYWSKLTCIIKSNFIRTTLPIARKSSNKRRSNSLTHGTLHIRINDVRFFYRVIGWIDGLKEYFKGP